MTIALETALDCPTQSIKKQPLSFHDLLSVFLNFREFSRTIARIRLTNPQDQEEFDILRDFYRHDRAEQTPRLISAIGERLVHRFVPAGPKPRALALMNLHDDMVTLVENLLDLGFIPPGAHQIRPGGITLTRAAAGRPKVPAASA